jgi:hypothetical protein
MRLRRLVILRGGFGAKHIRAAAHFISIFLINALTLNAQIAQRNERIIPLLVSLADQSSLSADLTFAVRAQSHAATLLWPYDRELARAIYRRAFQSLTAACDSEPDNSAAPDAVAFHSCLPPTITAIARQHLRIELLHEIAARDAELAEDLARAFTAPVAGASAGGASLAFNASPATSPTQSDVVRRDMLVSVALRVVKRDPARAMTLAQLSLAFGVSPHFSRLLLSLCVVDTGRAGLLFADAVDYLERSTDVDLKGLHTLGEFLVSATDSLAKEPVNRGVVVRFLDCALEQLSRRGRVAAGGAGDMSANQGRDAEDEAVIYFLGRQLGDLLALYMPDRLDQFKRKIAQLRTSNADDRATVPAPVYANNPYEIVRGARLASTAVDRDLLYAKAAFAWLARGDVCRAQAAAAKVVAITIRDRVMTYVACRYYSAGRIERAVAAARRIVDASARASLLTRLAGAALATRDRARATDLLDEAAECALVARPAMARARVLIRIAESITPLDARRGFEVMLRAVEAINEALTQREPYESARSNPGAAGDFEAGELYGSGFEATLVALGRADFERALSLAEQLSARDISVLAQLAVCRGVLGRPSNGGRAAQ